MHTHGSSGPENDRPPSSPNRQKPGPEPDHLVLDEPWEDAVKRALRKQPKKKPPEPKKGSKD